MQLFFMADTGGAAPHGLNTAKGVVLTAKVVNSPQLLQYQTKLPLPLWPLFWSLRGLIIVVSLEWGAGEGLSAIFLHTTSFGANVISYVKVPLYFSMLGS